MKDDAIILRPAEAADAEEIRQMVHAEGKTWSIEQIYRNIDRLFVLIHKKRILGVLCGTFTKGKETVSWVTVHPMYPESAVQTAMINGLWGVLCRKPYIDKDWETKKKFSLSRWFKTVSAHFKIRGVKHGVSGQQEL